MDKEYLKEQIILLLTGEKTDISEGEIRKEVSGNPELQKEYEEVSALLLASQKTAPPVAQKRWAEFMGILHENIKQREEGILIKLAGFFKSPVRVAAAASIAAVLIIAILFVLNNTNEINIVKQPTEYNESDYANIEEVNSIEQIDRSFSVAESVIPSDEELTIIENIYAEFRSREENSATNETIESKEIEFEELRRYYIPNENEDMS